MPSTELRYLIAYDIADDRRRNRIATELLNFGRRLQESLFLCHLAPERKAALLARLDPLLAPLEDKLLLIPACQSCWSQSHFMGTHPKPAEPEFYLH